MNIKINYSLYNDMFAVPSQVAQKYLKFASHSQLKVLLYILKFGAENIEPSKLDITEDELKEAIIYWQQENFLFKDDQACEYTEKKPAGSYVAPKPIKPDRRQVAQRSSESKEIAVLIRQAEVKFGRILRQNEASTLVYLVDSVGIKPAVLLMIIDYAISQGRATVSFIENTAAEWASRDINTVNGAEKEILRLERVKSDWGIVSRSLSIADRRPSKKEAALAYKWIEEYNFSEQMLRLAYDRCVDSTGKVSVSYISKILDGWHKKGYQSPQDVVNNDKNNDNENKTSFDLGLFEKMINED